MYWDELYNVAEINKSDVINTGYTTTTTKHLIKKYMAILYLSGNISSTLAD